MKKNRKSDKSKSKPRIGAKNQFVFRSNTHRVHDTDFDADYDALYDEIDLCDFAVSERSFMETFDGRSRPQRLRSRRRCWSPDWDQDIDDWN